MAGAGGASVSPVAVASVIVTVFDETLVLPVSSEAVAVKTLALVCVSETLVDHVVCPAGSERVATRVAPL